MIDSVLQKIRTNLLRVTYLDYRSLSFFRVLLGFVGLYRFTLALRWSEEFLAPDGFLPIVTLNVWATRWSVYFLNHTLAWGQLLSVFGLILSCMLILGIRTRTVLILLWITTLSLSARTHLIENNGHSVFRLMTLWSIFLPLDRHFLLFKGKSSSLVENGVPKVIGISACAFFLQFIFIYLFAGLTKNDSTWAMNGTAVYSSLNLGAFAKPLGVSISRNHELTRFLTSVTTVAEMLMPFLLLLDTKRVSLRLLAVGFFVAMQVGFFATLEVGIFPFAMIAYTLAFLPSCFWEKYVRCNDYSQKEDRKVGKTEKSALRNLIVSMLLLLSTFDVIGSSFKSKYTTLPNWLQETVYSVRVDQRWWMFVVSEWRDFWIDVEAIQGDGGVIDVWSWQRGATDLSFSKERPNDIRDVFSEQPWNNYIHQLKDNALLREWFLFNLCHKYNLANPANKIRELKLHYSYRTILGIDEFTPVSHEVIAEWKCES